MALARSDNVCFIFFQLLATLLANQSNWYCQVGVDLGRCVWRSCIVQLLGVTWAFVSFSLLWSSRFGSLLCIQLLDLLLLAVPPVSVSRIPLNIHLDFFSLFLSLLLVLRAGPWTLLLTYPCTMAVMLSLPVCIA